MIANETWFTANEAVEIGLAHKVNEHVEDDDVVIQRNLKIMYFRNSEIKINSRMNQ